LLRIINDILDITKVEAGKNPLIIEELLVETLIKNMKNLFQHLASKKSLHFTIINHLPNVIYTDYYKLTHIIRNLLSNAFKFTSKGAITLTMQSVENEFIIKVVDTGIGMSEKAQAHIFQEFQQADSSTSRKYGGTGLGLSIAQSYAHLLKGELSVYSQENKGTTFTLTIPTLQASDITHKNYLQEQTTIEIENKEDYKQYNFEKSNILLFDNNSKNHFLLDNILNTTKAHIYFASTKEELFDLVEEKSIDIIIMEIIEDDLSTLKEIRNRPKLTYIPILIATSRTDVKYKLLSKTIGCEAYMNKPLDINKFLSTIEKLLP
jgi:two-component system, chemotaxis family, sensor kinase CheA